MATLHKRDSRPRPKTRKRPAVRMLAAARIPAALASMAAPSGTARFSAGKALAATAERAPGRVYPHFDAIAALLASESKVVRWNAMQTLAALAAADGARKWDAILDTYLAFIQGDNLISAANAIHGAGQVARARPDLLDRIVPALLGVQNAVYATSECRNVAIGEVLGVLAAIGPGLASRPEVAEFVRRQASNTRAKAARSAERLIAEWGLRG